MKEIEIKTLVKVYSLEELSPADRELVETAKQATYGSYAPYSKFYVGAAARLSDGTITYGNNQENAAFPSGLCAERTTLFHANAAYPDQYVTALAIAARTNHHFLKQPIPPCGACRQVMIGCEERYGQPMRVLLYGEDGTYVVSSAKDLLPLQFTGDSMI